MSDERPEELLVTVPERAAYLPPPCPRCGGPQIPTFIESGHSGGRRDRLFRLTHLYCPGGC